MEANIKLEKYKMYVFEYKDGFGTWHSQTKDWTSFIIEKDYDGEEISPQSQQYFQDFCQQYHLVGILENTNYLDGDKNMKEMMFVRVKDNKSKS